MIFDFVRLMRPWQWYKNVVVAIPLVFGGMLLDLGSVVNVLVAFISLCLASSGNYVLNDLMDRKRDVLNPEKKSRPIASGRVSVALALLLLVVLWGIAAGLALTLGLGVFIFVGALVISSTAYSLFLKHEPIADVIMVAINFLLRAEAGAPAVGVEASPWMSIGVFFFALYLAVAKRHGEVTIGTTKARKVLAFYSPELTRALMIASFSLLTVCYAIASFMGRFQNVIWTVPVMLYAGLRHFMLVLSGNVIGRHTHLAVRDLRLVLSGILWLLLVLGLIYL